MSLVFLGLALIMGLFVFDVDCRALMKGKVRFQGKRRL